MLALTGEAIRILVVDDSASYRQTICNVLREVPDASVVGTAKNGMEALEHISGLNPDLLTLDVNMPDMDGIEVLREINKRRLRSKAIMVSSLTSEGAQVTTDALLEGAFDFILKPSGNDSIENREQLRDALDEKIYAFRQTSERRRLRTRRRAKSTIATVPDAVVEEPPTPKSIYRAVLIGTSTGGPAALKVVLPKLPTEISVPVLVVQHMPAHYTKSLAARLDDLCQLDVVEAKDGEEVRAGTVLIAPGDRQMKVTSRNGRAFVLVTDDPPENGCRPSVDYLFRSAVEVFQGQMLGVIMTGMGRDGTKGCDKLKHCGGYVFAQQEESCVVYGMPKATIEQGLADRVLPLGKIGPAIVRHVKRSRQA